ncbi:hypothetical protein GCM10023349_25740 [Nocardioides conyzicola]|uniref:DUF3558 domain-containing protein n=2 Tax=Nocardioides conyzicola TaxID=1651781 RepID=A0ABP8XFB6_9ACTN
MRALMLVAATAAATVLAGCSSDGSDPSTASSPDASAIAGVGWSPCDALTAKAVSRLVGADVDENAGTADAPRCTFTPAAKGGAAYDVSYLYFDGGLDAALDAMGATGAQLKPVDVAGADSARLVVSAKKAGVLVTGFVQTGGLVQSVNAAQPTPYDRAQVVTGTKALLAALAEAAPTSTPGQSPTMSP